MKIGPWNKDLTLKLFKNSRLGHWRSQTFFQGEGQNFREGGG
jgi:hypothetical protein